MNVDKRLVALIIVAIATVSAFACVAVFTSADYQNEDNSYDLSGHWYTVRSTGYDLDGSYYDYDSYGAIDDGFDVYGGEGILFYGWFKDNNMCGTLSGKMLTYYDVIDSVRYTGLGVLVDDSTIYSIIMQYYTDDSGKMYTACNNSILSRDYNCDKEYIDVPDLGGLWSYTSAMAYNGDIELVGSSNITVSEQNGTVFRGTMEQYTDDGARNSYGIIGTVLENNGSVLNGIMMDARGNIWNTTLNDGYLVLDLVVNFQYRFPDSDFKIGVIQRVYSQDPEAKPITFQSADLENSIWKSVSSYSVDEFGNISTQGANAYMLFDGQYSNMFTGRIVIGTDEVRFVGCIQNYTQTTWHIISENFKTIPEIEGWKDSKGDIHIMTTQYDGGTILKTYTIYTLYEGSDEYTNLEGHWYTTYRSGYYGDDSYEMETVTSNPELSKYDLDIYKVCGNVFWGRFIGEKVSGTIVDNMVTISYFENSRSNYMLGWILNDNSLMLNDTYCLNTKEFVTAAYATYYTKNLGNTMTDNITLDLTGTWDMVVGYAYNGETTHEFSPSTLTIDEMKGGLFKGSMGQLFNGVPVEVGIKGSLYRYDVSDCLNGFLIDDDGTVWYVLCNEDTISLTLTDKTENPWFMGDMVVAERAYSRSGEYNLDYPDVDLTGEWKATNTQYMSEYGEFNEVDNYYHLIVESNHDNKYTGKCIDVILEGRFSMATLEMGNSILIKYSCIYDYAEDVQFGYGIYIDGKIILIEQYINSTGVMWTQYTVFEKKL